MGEIELETDTLKTSCVMSVPRLGFMDNFFTVFMALVPKGIKLRKCGGAFWGQCLSRAIVETLEQDKPDAILTVDYDSVFTLADLDMLQRLMLANPHADAIAPIQYGRGINGPLMTMVGPDGKPAREIERSTLDGDLTAVRTAHFGCTLIRSRVFERIAKPWFFGRPDANGDWSGDRVDDDIWFWNQMERAGLRLFQANRVTIGHLELSVLWPDENLELIHQQPLDFFAGGKPKDAWK